MRVKCSDFMIALYSKMNGVISLTFPTAIELSPQSDIALPSYWVDSNVPCDYWIFEVMVYDCVTIEVTDENLGNKIDRV